MHLRAMQEELRGLLDEADRIIGAARRERREATSHESKRLSVIDSRSKELQEDIEGASRADKHARSIEARRAAMRPTQRPIDDGSPDELTEDRSQFNSWPVEDARDFFRAAKQFSDSRTLPGDMNSVLRETFAGALELRSPSGQNTIVGDEGAILVPENLSNVILQKMHQEGQILNRCQQVNITSGRATTWNAIKENARTSGSRYGGIIVSRKGESIAAEISKAKFEPVKLELKKQTCAVAFTEEQIEDAAQTVSIIETLIPKAFVFADEREIIEGAGAAEMEGVLNSPALITVGKESGQSAATVIFENIEKMWNSLHPSSRTSAVWFINPDAEPQLRSMFITAGTAGIPVFLPSQNVSTSPYATLLGRPVIPTEHNPVLGTKGDIILADMSNYLYASKGSLRSAMSIHVLFLQGESVMRVIERNDGKTWWRAPLTPAKGSTTRSPFITLETRE